jgi:catechol 2,3-dioxygenase-like lactoylglutathione lyase family enzyme
MVVAPRLGHVALPAEDPERLAEFYRRLFGLELVRTTENELGGRMALLSGRPDEEDHELAFVTRPQAAHVALRVVTPAELVSVHRLARSGGVPLLAERDSGSALSVFIRDPEGNAVEIYWATGRPYRASVRPLDLSV